MGDKRGQISNLDLSPAQLMKIEKDAKTVFKQQIKCTHEEHCILLMKAYSNVLEGCEIISISKDVPKSEIDDYKQYDKKMKVTFVDPEGEERFFYMSYHFSGKEGKFYYKAKYRAEKKVKEALAVLFVNGLQTLEEGESMVISPNSVIHKAMKKIQEEG